MLSSELSSIFSSSLEVFEFPIISIRISSTENTAISGIIGDFTQNSKVAKKLFDLSMQDMIPRMLTQCGSILSNTLLTISEIRNLQSLPLHFLILSANSIHTSLAVIHSHFFYHHHLIRKIFPMKKIRKSLNTHLLWVNAECKKTAIHKKYNGY